MIKAQNLKKQLIKISIIASVVVLATGAAAYGIFAWSSSLQEEAAKTKSQVGRARGDVSNREKKNKEAQEYLDLYNSINTDSEQDKISDLNRDKAMAWIKQVALANHILNMTGTVTPISTVDNQAFKKKTFEGINSKISLKFGAMTDEQIFRFLQALLGNFPGYVKVESLTLSKQGEITQSIIQQAQRGQFPELVTGELVFYWIGVRELADTPTAQSGGVR